MLAAGFESAFELDADHALARPFAEFLHEGLFYWSQWAPDLAALSPQPLGYESYGSLTPAFETADVARLDQAAAQAEALGVPAMRVDAAALARMEPNLEQGLGALVFGQDGQLDNRALGPALALAVQQAGGRVREGVRVAALDRQAGCVTGVRLADGTRLTADLVILASGAERLAGTPLPAQMTPVKGQMISFTQARDQAPHRVVRGLSIYLAAKPDGRLIAGASVEPGRTSTGTDPETLEALADAARRAAPGLSGLEITESWSGLRPRARDAMPVVGEVEPGLYLALGGYRNGVLAAPGLAALMEQALGVAEKGMFARVFAPDRLGVVEKR